MATAAAVANDCECFADEQEDEEVAVSFEVVSERLSTAEAVAVFVKKSEEASFSNSSSAKIIILNLAQPAARDDLQRREREKQRRVITNAPRSRHRFIATQSAIIKSWVDSILLTGTQIGWRSIPALRHVRLVRQITSQSRWLLHKFGNYHFLKSPD